MDAYRYDPADLRAEIINGEEMIDCFPSCLSGKSFLDSANVFDSLRFWIETLSAASPCLTWTYRFLCTKIKAFNSKGTVRLGHYSPPSFHEMHNNSNHPSPLVSEQCDSTKNLVFCKPSDLNSNSVNLDGTNVRFQRVQRKIMVREEKYELTCITPEKSFPIQKTAHQQQIGFVKPPWASACRPARLAKVFFYCLLLVLGVWTDRRRTQITERPHVSSAVVQGFKVELAFSCFYLKYSQVSVNSYWLFVL